MDMEGKKSTKRIERGETHKFSFKIPCEICNRPDYDSDHQVVYCHFQISDRETGTLRTGSLTHTFICVDCLRDWVLGSELNDNPTK